jgi:hypothetical protein
VIDRLTYLIVETPVVVVSSVTNSFPIISWTNLGTKLSSDDGDISFITDGSITFDLVNNALVSNGTEFVADFTSLRSDKTDPLWIEYELWLPVGIDQTASLTFGEGDDTVGWYDHRIYFYAANVGTSAILPKEQWVKLAFKRNKYSGGSTDRVSALRYIGYVAPEPVTKLTTSGGPWGGVYHYFYVETTTEGRFLYGLDDVSDTRNAEYDVEYDPSDKKFHDVGIDQPFLWGFDDSSTNLSAFETAANMSTHHWYREGGEYLFSFTNPYYVADDPVGYGYDEIAYHTGAPMSAGDNYLQGSASKISLFYWDKSKWGGGAQAGIKIRNVRAYYTQPENLMRNLTQMSFNGSDTINLVNIPEDATKVELFRDGVSLGPLLIDGTTASVTIGTSRSYNARIYKVVDGLSYLLVETPVLSTVPPLTK